MKNSILACSLMGLFSVASAQQIYKSGGTDNSTFLLGNEAALHNQNVYVTSDLVNAMPGDIVRIYYRYGQTGILNGNTLTRLMIRMGQINRPGFIGNTFYNELDTVLDVPYYDVPPGSLGDWFPIDLDVPFTYDPSESLIIDIQFDSSMTSNFGCMGVMGSGAKMYSDNRTDTTGTTSAPVLEDVGFDLDPNASVNGPQVWTNSLTVAPNPTNTTVTLAWTDEAPASVRLFDGLGKMVKEYSNLTGTELRMDTNELNEGYYFVRSVLHNGTTVVKRFSKVR